MKKGFQTCNIMLICIFVILSEWHCIIFSFWFVMIALPLVVLCFTTVSCRSLHCNCIHMKSDFTLSIWPVCPRCRKGSEKDIRTRSWKWGVQYSLSQPFFLIMNLRKIRCSSLQESLWPDLHPPGFLLVNMHPVVMICLVCLDQVYFNSVIQKPLY